MAGGRPPREPDWEMVKRLCTIQCTQDEIAAVTGISVDTLDRHSKATHGVSFAEFFRQNRSGGRASLRRSQWLTAVDKKNPAMLIWLGKQYLDQKDKADVDLPNAEIILKYKTE